ncbi:plasma membrane ATPase 1-like [Dorcoceras hygrometricum]|uniref:Plasma membrane ATPase 1-like n=1 Tax=Dorcoceras hygrometricum TaxID=472368 RepID=A0A2Z7D929_9LAMI|nr:plasma membrane ATPase 1-like [Dorcoceras hygrometricum]
MSREIYLFGFCIIDERSRQLLSTRSVLGKCVYLVTLAMSLFDIQDVCIAIGSIATLDLPMVVDLIGIYGLKGPYCTLTTTNWFLQPPPPPPPLFAGKSFPANLDEENPSTLISSGLLVQADEGIPSPVVDLIDDIYRRLP